MKQALRDKETAESNFRELSLSLDGALHAAQHILQLEEKSQKSQKWEEEKEQMLEQMRRYKKDGDTKSSALAQAKEKVAEQLASLLQLREENNKLNAERDDLDIKVLHTQLPLLYKSKRRMFLKHVKECNFTVRVA